MLEKIGLPPKPSLRGNTWVVDASNCQGCSSQFTFINRKHHCRRCGGIFCGSCTQQRMVLRGQGDSPVRICEPCKKLEEAARFELRYGHKSKSSRGIPRCRLMSSLFASFSSFILIYNWFILILSVLLIYFAITPIVFFRKLALVSKD